MLRRFDSGEAPRRSPLESTSSLDALYRFLLLRITLFGVTRLQLLHTEDHSTADGSFVPASTAGVQPHGQIVATTVVACQSTPGDHHIERDLRRREVHQRRAVPSGVSIARSAHRGRHHQRTCQRVDRQRSNCR